jgi:arylsulfatase
VPKEWADRYKGKFDEGWDACREKVFARQKELGLVAKDAVLSRHDPDVQDWTTLSADERRLYARMMEVFAGFLTHADHYIGELIGFLKKIGESENTLIMLISDNGASAEGGPTGSVNESKFFNNVPEDLKQNLAAIDDIGSPKYFNHYPWGWTHAGNTPFRRWKRETYRGGVSDPFIVCWPKGMKARGDVRTQYAHAIDLVPTVLEALGLEAPAAIRGVTQSPIEGVSFAHTFDDAKAPSRHTTQYFEMFGHRALYHEGWRAVCPWPGTSFVESGLEFGAPISAETLTELDAKGWELYNLTNDPAETNNLAEKERERLIAMIGMWYAEAGKYNVLPIDSRGTLKLAEPRPQISGDRDKYMFYPGTQIVPGNAAPKLLNRTHSVTAEVDIPRGGAEGVLFSMGGNDGGFSFYVKDGKLRYSYNYVAQDYFYIGSSDRVPEGHHFLSFEFKPTGKPDIGKGKGTPATVRLLVDGKEVGRGDLPVTTPLGFGLGAGAAVGVDPGSPATPEYKPPFKFTGRITRVQVDTSGESIEDKAAKFRAVMARQ